MTLQKTYNDVIERANKEYWNDYKSRHGLKTEQDVLEHFSEIYNVNTEEAKRNLEKYKLTAIMTIHGECI